MPFPALSPAHAPSAGPRISVVISTYNRRHQLEETLSPPAADPAVSQLVVTVDGSADGSFERLDHVRAERPAIDPVQLGRIGKRRARQAGLDRRTEDTVVIDDMPAQRWSGIVSGSSRRRRLPPAS